jgi:hypothetical protein
MHATEPQTPKSGRDTHLSGNHAMEERLVLAVTDSAEEVKTALRRFNDDGIKKEGGPDVLVAIAALRSLKDSIAEALPDNKVSDDGLCAMARKVFEVDEAFSVALDHLRGDTWLRPSTHRTALGFGDA